MNYINVGSVIRHCRLLHWANLGCKDNVATIPQPKLYEIQSYKTNCRKIPAMLFEKTRGFKQHHVQIWPSCTQVRCSQNHPKYHRDLPFPNFDDYRKEKYKDVSRTFWGLGVEKSGFTYVVGYFGLLCGCYGLKSELTHFISYMGAAADVLAMASIEVDLSKIAPGACLSYKWRGKPLFIKHRTQADIHSEANTPMSALRDPQTPEERATNPEWLIVIGICTHLGCVPIPNSGDWAGGFYCPCHGSHYDNVGSARKGPAPLNLEVPPYTFISDTLVIVG